MVGSTSLSDSTVSPTSVIIGDCTHPENNIYCTSVTPSDYTNAVRMTPIPGNSNGVEHSNASVTPSDNPAIEEQNPEIIISIAVVSSLAVVSILITMIACFCVCKIKQNTLSKLKHEEKKTKETVIPMMDNPSYGVIHFKVPI